MTQPGRSHPDSPLTGIAFKIVSVAVFVAMSSMIKAAGPVPTGQVVFFRSFFAILPIMLFLAWHRDLRGALYTKRPVSHFLRGLVGVTSMALGFFGLARLPLPESVTINYAQPLLVVVFSALILHETIRFYRWSAVVVGLVGVFIVSWPKLTLFGEAAAFGGDEALGAIATLGGATASALAMILVRSLVHTEKTSTIVIWFSLSAAALSLVSIPFGWQALTMDQAALLVGAGICGGVAQLLMTEAYRHAEASVVAPFEYTSMLLAIAVGYVVFGDVPTLHMLVGGLIVVGAGLFIILRERRLGIERAAAKEATPPQ
ncbi:DMT family transporter [Mesorhizobium sp. LHD-90]|uniref:DMT family transporter n=1 Tax=Mesorhizobium sp. LHD-90 TaxID=3071414 RepID=UPI0027E133F6|nr:DMT family transporter [Mesorhizobium sp. LHD-90]MDQ6436914.1 DMT family transporter [Mesorhizobium sp. LHD-90]